MQKGFLRESSSRVPVAEVNDISNPTNATDNHLQECLELLRGPGDERKYVIQVGMQIRICIVFISFAAT